MAGAKDLVQRAAEFARRAHRSVGQVRRYTGEPYEVHPQAVAAMVAEVNQDPEVVAAAWLHDVVEDTPVTLEEVEAAFGPRVAALVADLTDVSLGQEGNRAVRKALDLAHIARAAPEAKTIKLADLMDNLRSILANDRRFARTYLMEMERLLEVLKDGDRRLYERAVEEHRRGMALLDAASSTLAPAAREMGGGSVYLRMRRLFLEGFTAMDIAEPLPLVPADAPHEEVARLMEESGHEVVGLIQEGRVTGYAARGPEAGEMVRRSPIPTVQLLPAMASLAEVIGVLALHPHCFVSTLGGVEGVITRGHVEKPPVRMWLFGMITIIEMFLTRFIEAHYPGEGWRTMISQGRLQKAQELVEERRRRGQHCSLLDCLQLADKAGIVMKDPAMRRDFGARTKREGRRIIKALESLRNNLAHGQSIVSHDWETIVAMAGRMERILTRV